MTSATVAGNDWLTSHARTVNGKTVLDVGGKEHTLPDGCRGSRERRLHAMPERRYFDESGEPSDAPGRFVQVDELDPLSVGPGLEFRPVTTDTVMTNFVSFEPNTPAPMHHHVEQQIAIVLAGELTLSVGDETKVMHAGDCVVIPPHVPHGGASGPEGCRVLDVFTPPRAAIVSLMAT